MLRCIVPGSFDPVTSGHLDLIRRAHGLCDSVIVAVLPNESKQPFFSLEERMAFLHRSLESLDHVVVDSFDGLLVDYATKMQAQAIVRGLRTGSDWEYETQMAIMNRRMAPGIETIFLPAPAGEAFISATLIRQVGRLGGDLSGLVPDCILSDVAHALRFGRV